MILNIIILEKLIKIICNFLIMYFYLFNLVDFLFKLGIENENVNVFDLK